MWKSLENDISPISVLNRGFGGSTIPEVTYYADRIILPHQPKILVFYCGENDLANDDAKSKLALKSFKKFYTYMKKNLPETEVFFIAIKPSVKRWNYWNKMNEANSKIKKFVDRKDNYYFVDTASKMLDENGIVLQDIFIKDNLHMNAKGYEIWTNTLKPILEQHYAN
jgi:lysophospholipase L1-like esterase